MAGDLLSRIDREASLHWLGLILLLDQMPRNIYRGEQARVAFTIFDPLAQEVARRAIGEGIPNDAKVSKRVVYRCWFFFPLMHSEDAELHKECVSWCSRLVDDAKKSLGGAADGDLGLAVKFAENLCGVEERHRAIIERFGRYPYRDQVLGRHPTPEEEAYLRDGGETFGG